MFVIIIIVIITIIIIIIIGEQAHMEQGQDRAVAGEPVGAQQPVERARLLPTLRLRGRADALGVARLPQPAPHLTGAPQPPGAPSNEICFTDDCFDIKYDIYDSMAYITYNHINDICKQIEANFHKHK